MSASTEEAADAPEPDVEDADDQDDEELPDVPEESTMADVDLDAVDEEIDESDDDQDDELEHTDAEAGSSSSTWGDYYVKGLVNVSNAVIDEYGDEGAEEVSEEMARDLDLDEAFNEWFKQHGGTDEMEPGQAVLVGTLMFLVAVVAANTTLVTNLADELQT